MGFGITWRKWISGCLHSAFGSVLVNGSPTKEFKIKKGLCQGDPLSPFLFILAVEALNVAFLEAKNKKIFRGIHVGKNKIYISHLQFANDALIIGEWSIENARNLFRLLRCFHMALGLKINFAKSKLFGIGVAKSDVDQMATTLNHLCSHATIKGFQSEQKRQKAHLGITSLRNFKQNYRDGN